MTQTQAGTAHRTFVVRPVDADVVAQLRVVDDAGRRPVTVVDTDGGSPLRCCLRLSRPGEPLLLLSYAPLRRWAAAHDADPAAYDETGPVFVHPVPCDGADTDGWPAELRGSPRVLRAYDVNGRLLGGTVVGADDEPERAVEELYADDRVALVHARALVHGCFTFAVERVDTRR